MVPTRSTMKQNDIDDIKTSGEDLRSFIEKLLKKHTTHLERQISDLKDEIKILKETNIDMIKLLSKDNRPFESEKNYSHNDLEDLNSPAETVIENDTKRNKPQKSHVNIPLNSAKSMDQHSFKREHTAHRRNSRNTAIIGTSSSNVAAEFTGARRRLWIYVGKCLPRSTSHGIKSYLETRKNISRTPIQC
ncbi:hypothetical protein JTB14_026694 [Gonioctena quinquepunctata]|nr:hypothetical protein JTB14_026694 [Gonioctena quinquepunctata]